VTGKLAATALAVIGAVALLNSPAAAQTPGTPTDALRVEQHAPAPQQAGNKDVQVRTSVSQTAIWVGDPVELVFEFTCAPNIDVLEDDLVKDKLKLDGFEVLSASTERLAAPDGGRTIRRFRYQLTSYRVSSPSLTIGPQTVRYYVRRVGERPQDAQPAGELQLAPIVVARRSTLPDELPGLELRDANAISGLPAWLPAARPLGFGLMALAATPLAVWTIAAVRARSRRDHRPSARVVRSHGRAALDELRSLDVSTEKGRIEAYGRLEHAVRQHLHEKRGIPAHALCPSEVAAKLGGAPNAETAAELLAECERARYGPPDRVPTADRFTAAIQRAEEFLGAGA
jgi:hypothetical protein